MGPAFLRVEGTHKEERERRQRGRATVATMEENTSGHLVARALRTMAASLLDTSPWRSRSKPLSESGLSRRSRQKARPKENMHTTIGPGKPVYADLKRPITPAAATGGYKHVANSPMTAPRERTCSLVKSKQEATGSIDLCNMKVASTFPWAVAPNDDCGQTRQARVYPKGVQAALRLLRNHHGVRCDGNARTERTVGSDWSDAVNHDPVHAEGRRLYKSAATTCAAQSISSLGDAASP